MPARHKSRRFDLFQWEQGGRVLFHLCREAVRHQSFVTTAPLNRSGLSLRRLVFLKGTRRCVCLVWQSEAEERKSHKENFNFSFQVASDCFLSSVHISRPFLSLFWTYTEISDFTHPHYTVGLGDVQRTGIWQRPQEGGTAWFAHYRTSVVTAVALATLGWENSLPSPAKGMTSALTCRHAFIP